MRRAVAECRRFALGAVRDMANRRGLRLVGFAYGGVVVLVALTALIIVISHINTPVEARPDPLIASAR